MKYEYAVIGGDERQHYLAEILAQKHSVIVFGVTSSCQGAVEGISLEKTIQQAECILAPIPLTKDGKNMYMQSKLPQDKKIMIGTLFQILSPNQRIYAGAVPREWMLWARRNQFRLTDYMNIEEIAWKNAVATAEGTLAEAICRYPDNMQGTQCLILGCGRCGMAIAQLFRAVGAKVTVCARRKEVIYKGKVFGYDMRELKELNDVISCQDIVVNTVPARILDEKHLKLISSKTLILDVASQGGGTDFEMACNLGIPAVLCSGLPGKYAPRASAKILAEWIENEDK